MNNDHQDNSNARSHPLSHTFSFGTTIQNVLRNINHAFANHNPSTGQQETGDSRDDALPVGESVSSLGGTLDSSAAAPIASVPAVSSLADADVLDHSHLGPSRDDDDDDSVPELQSIADSLDESDTGVGAADPGPSRRSTLPVNEGREGLQTGDEATSPPIAPVTGTRRTRVDDDGDDDRDRRHPSERVGGPPPVHNTAPQNAGPQQPPRLPPGMFAPLFGSGPIGGNQPTGEVPPDRVHTGEATADPPTAGNNPFPGPAPRGIPVLAGFTFTIPIFGPPPGNRPGQAPGAQGGAGAGVGAQGMFGMDAAAREEFLASFAAFFQEFQAAEEAREDPERAKKLVAGLEVVPLGLVKRLERVGGAPGGHIGDSTDEGTSGCAICWDTLLDAEGDGFSSQQLTDEAAASSFPSAEGQSEEDRENMAMDVDASSDHQIASGSPSEALKIISLPCAHVFHASCLLPWFTRAKQATCPTCRFNIDPENLTYTPRPRRPFHRPGSTRPNAPAAPADLAAAPSMAPSEVDPAHTADIPTADPVHPNMDARTATPPVQPGPTTPPTAGQPGAQPQVLGFNPFVVAGIPILSFPAIQIPLGQPTQTADGGNQGMDVLTIGLDMFVGGPPPQEQGSDRRDNTEGIDGATNGDSDPGTAGGNAPQNPGFAQDLQSLIEGLLRTTRNIIPQVINGQVPVPPTAGTDGDRTDGAQPQPPPQARPAPEMAGPHPVPPQTGGPRAVPAFPFVPNMFRPTRPMPPRREPKAWTLPPPPGPSLRQHVEQRERERGLRCSDTSCGVGPSDDDPYPDPGAPLTKQVTIHSLPCHDHHESDGPDGSVCSHAFHPSCLVSAERVAGWGGQDVSEPLVEVSCPVCRAVGCVTREEWESGVSAL